MAFDVTPTSGDSPYDFTATFDSRVSLDHDRYSLSLQSSEAEGSCPALGTSVSLGNGATSLLETGAYSTLNSVPAGSCRTYTLRIRDHVTNTYTSVASVQVTNI